MVTPAPAPAPAPTPDLITPHFRRQEFQQPARHGFSERPYPLGWVAKRLRRLCEQLEILREALGDHRIHVCSGYRTRPYNKAIKGAAQSQHCEGYAADIIVDDVHPKIVHDVALRLYYEGKLRIRGLGSYENFTHVDVRPANKLAHWSGSRLLS